RGGAAEAHAVSLVSEDEGDLDGVGVAGEGYLQIGASPLDLRKPAVLHDDGIDHRRARAIAIAESAVLRWFAQVLPVLLGQLETLVEAAVRRPQPHRASVQHGIGRRACERRPAGDDLLAGLDLHSDAVSLATRAQPELAARTQRVDPPAGGS